MEALLAQREIASGISFADVLCLLRVIIAYRHVRMEDGEFGDRSLFWITHCCFPHS